MLYALQLTVDGLVQRYENIDNTSQPTFIPCPVVWNLAELPFLNGYQIWTRDSQAGADPPAGAESVYSVRLTRLIMKHRLVFQASLENQVKSGGGSEDDADKAVNLTTSAAASAGAGGYRINPTPALESFSYGTRSDWEQTSLARVDEVTDSEATRKEPPTPKTKVVASAAAGLGAGSTSMQLGRSAQQSFSGVKSSAAQVCCVAVNVSFKMTLFRLSMSLLLNRSARPIRSEFMTL
jgi:hypothetical protein